ncbi:uncharacterized protein K444DRAFT_609894 [Hyaloscypha bicolor E]|uniref:Uncharacterized protein n=1 Tax=Hyaloscypha bicolor E TaxID=1095630 RepID=A0A2J6TL22_9HELO|nr:uncharacterized protein K444DRAFT_609894 [Hyaloscypha bicolor E]PMD63707.1 hypothetical protein K444DRAFT_609894 [Hyaloscypha bicolor E]
MMASAAPLRKYQTELRDTGYISREALKAKLVEIFGQMNFKISTKNERWIYYAPRRLTPEEMQSIMPHGET